MSNIKQEMVAHLDHTQKFFDDQLDYENHIDTVLFKKLSNKEIIISKSLDLKENPIGYKLYSKNGGEYIRLNRYYEPKKLYYSIIRNITYEKSLINNIYTMMLIFIIIGIILILLYAKHLSKKLMLPLQQLTEKFSAMHENLLHKIDTTGLPHEFVSLTDSINFMFTPALLNSENVKKLAGLRCREETRRCLTFLRILSRFSF